jgi:hypothetical protein
MQESDVHGFRLSLIPAKSIPNFPKCSVRIFFNKCICSRQKDRSVTCERDFVPSVRMLSGTVIEPINKNRFVKARNRTSVYSGFGTW